MEEDMRALAVAVQQLQASAVPSPWEWARDVATPLILIVIAGVGQALSVRVRNVQRLLVHNRKGIDVLCEIHEDEDSPKLLAKVVRYLARQVGVDRYQRAVNRALMKASGIDGDGVMAIEDTIDDDEVAL